MDVSGKVDDSEVQAALSQLTGELAESLVRSMAVAGGRVIRDEARVRAPVESGGLRDAIYVAYQDKRSTKETAVYSVSWNKVKAPHGHLLEFGHWQTRVAYLSSDGKWYSGPAKQPKWIAAKPFLRPALDAAGAHAQEAMADRARERLPELLSQVKK